MVVVFAGGCVGWVGCGGGSICDAEVLFGSCSGGRVARSGKRQMDSVLRVDKILKCVVRAAAPGYQDLLL